MNNSKTPLLILHCNDGYIQMFAFDYTTEPVSSKYDISVTSDINIQEFVSQVGTSRRSSSALEDSVEQRKELESKFRTDKPQKCLQCLTSLYIEFEEHIKMHGFNDNHSFPCSTCGKLYDYNIDFIAKHNNKSVIEELCEQDNNEFMPLSSEKNSDYPYRCLKPKCTKKFVNEDELMQHIKQSGHDCSASQYKCEYCGKRFGHLSAMTRHRKIHTQMSVFICSICSKSFNSNDKLLQHTNANHSYKCHICRVSFEDSASFTSHVDSGCKGSGNKPVDEHINVENTYRCLKPLCRSVFKTDEELQEHITVHSHDCSGYKYECRICSTRFQYLNSWKRHQIRHVTDVKPFPCNLCILSFDNENALLRHKRNHFKGKTRKCWQCNKSFRDTHMLVRHKATHSLIRKNRSSNNSITSHSPDVDIDTTNDTAETRHISKLTVADKDAFMCYHAKCNQIFESYDDLKLHQSHFNHNNIGYDYVCDFCPIRYQTPNGLEQHIQKHQVSHPHMCRFCSRPFDQEFVLKQHESQHFRGKRYKCPDCDDLFVDKNDFVRHSELHSKFGSVIPEQNQIKHSLPMTRKQFRYKCTQYCNKEFNSITRLKKHHCPFQEPQAPEQRKLCHICSKTFANNTDLSSHLICHNSVKPYVCDVCHADFLRKAQLKRHSFTHKSECERTFQCDDCESTFFTSADRTRHARKHMKREDRTCYQCSLCKKTYLSPWHVRNHLKKCHPLLLVDIPVNEDENEEEQ